MTIHVMSLSYLPWIYQNNCHFYVVWSVVIHAKPLEVTNSSSFDYKINKEDLLLTFWARTSPDMFLLNWIKITKSLYETYGINMRIPTLNNNMMCYNINYRDRDEGHFNDTYCILYEYASIGSICKWLVYAKCNFRMI